MTDQYDAVPAIELIDRAVAEDDEGVRNAAVARIGRKAEAVKSAMDAGVSPADYKRLETVHSALLTSANVVGTCSMIAKAKREKGE